MTVFEFLGIDRDITSELRGFLVRQTVGTFVLRAAAAPLGLIIGVVLARVLGAQGYGVYAFVMSMVTILVIPGMLGLERLLVRFFAVYKARKKWGLARGLWLSANRVVLLSSVGLASLTAVIAWFAQGIFDPEIANGMVIAAGMIPLIVLLQLRTRVLQGLGHVFVSLIPETVVQPAVLIILLMLFYITQESSLSSPLVLALHLGAVGTATLLAVALTRSYLPAEMQAAAKAFDNSAWVRAAIPLLMVGGLRVINLNVDILMLGTLDGTVAVGLYKPARSLVMLIEFGLAAVNMALAPVVAQLYATGQFDRLQRVVTASARAALLYAIPTTFCLLAFGDWILLFYGDEFVEGQGALVILAIGQLVNAAAGSVGLLLNMTGHERDTAKGLAIAVFANIVLNALLIPHLGIVGAAIGTAVSHSIWNVLLAIWVYRRLGIHTTAAGRIGWGSSSHYG